MNEPKTVWIGKDFGKEKKYACKHCSATFEKPQSLGAHVTAHHSRGPDVLEWVMGERKKWKDEGQACPFRCGFESHNPRELAKHMMDSHKKEIEENVRKFKEKQLA